MQKHIVYYNQALDYAKEGLWLEAESLLEQAISLESQVAEYHSLLAVVYLGLKKRRPAIVQLRLAYQLNVQDPLLQEWMALLILGHADQPDDKDEPPGSAPLGRGGSKDPRPPFPPNPYPFTPSEGAEALPDNGSSQTP